MKKEKGFTLIELLAIIVILAIIALIAVPTIMNILNKSNKSAFKDTAYGVISAGELYFAEQQLDLNGMKEEKTFTFPTDEIDVEGNVPEGTVLKVNTEGKIALSMSNERYCITKGYSNTDITVTEDIENCEVEKTLSELITVPNECTINKTEDACTLGTLFTIRVNNNETKNFYVIKDEGEKVTLIMSENLGNVIKWHSATTVNSQGPTTAIDYLDELTDDEWSNIPNKDYTYSGIGHDETTRKYDDITRNMRARMITYSEVDKIRTANGSSTPDWLYGNLYTSTNTLLPQGYWTSTANASSFAHAWFVSHNGYLTTNNVTNATNYGVRPVIELSK